MPAQIENVHICTIFTTNFVVCTKIMQLMQKYAKQKYFVLLQFESYV